MLMFRGIFVPHVTPFDDNEGINEPALRELVRTFEEAGLDGLVSLGSNGEFPSLNFEEKLAVVGTVRDETSLPLIAGSTENSTLETVRLGKALLDLGVDALLVAPPYYFKPSAEELYSHYSRVADTLDGELFIYNVPKFTGINIPLPVIERLAEEHSNVVGIKDSSASMGRITELVRLLGKKFTVLAGTADVLYPSLVLGARGGVVAVANVVPELCAELYRAFRKGNHKRARELHMKVNLVNEVLVKRYSQTSAIKAAMELRGWNVGKPRSPFLPLREEGIEDVRKTLKEVGVL